MKTFSLLILLLAIAVPLSAQHGQNGYSGFSFIAPAEISVGRDDNFLVNRTPVSEQLLVSSLPASVLTGAPNIRPSSLSDTVYLLRAPMVGFLANNQKREFNLTYQPEFEFFQLNRDQNSWNNDAALSYTQLLSRRWSTYVGDEYRTSKDPSRTLANPLLLLPRAQYRENEFRGSISFQKSERTSYMVRYDNTVTSFGQYDPLQRSVLDSLASGVSLMYSHMMTRTQRLRVTYSVFNTTPWSHQREGEDHVATSFVAFQKPAQSITGEYRFSMNPKTVFEFTGGAVRTSLATNAVFSAFGDRRFGEVWFGGGFARELAFFGNSQSALPSGLTTNGFYDVFTVRLRGQPTRKVGIQFNVSGSKSAYGTLINTNNTVMGRSRIDYRLNDRLVAFFSAEVYAQNRNDYVQAPLARRRLFIGFDYSFASDGEQRTSRLIRDADNVALTEHGRLRTKPDQE